MHYGCVTIPEPLGVTPAIGSGCGGRAPCLFPQRVPPELWWDSYPSVFDGVCPPTGRYSANLQSLTCQTDLVPIRHINTPLGFAVVFPRNTRPKVMLRLYLELFYKLYHFRVALTPCVASVLHKLQLVKDLHTSWNPSCYRQGTVHTLLRRKQ